MYLYITLHYACTQHHTSQHNRYTQETWQRNDTYYNDFTLPGYNMYFQPAIFTTHGGLIIYIKSTLNSTLHSTIYEHSTAWEAMFIEIKNLQKSLKMGNIYRPSHDSNELITKFNDEFRKAMHQKIMNGKKLIMSGDFNINLLKINEKISYANFFDMMTYNYLVKKRLINQFEIPQNM